MAALTRSVLAVLLAACLCVAAGEKESLGRKMLMDKETATLAAANHTPLPKAFLILLHGGYAQMDEFEALWHRIYTPESFYVLHLHSGSHSDIHGNLKYRLAGNGTMLPNVKMMDPKCITWAGPNMNAVLMEGLRMLLEMGDWSHFLLLSGTHYPIRPNWYIDTFLRANQGLSFVHGTFLNVSQWQYPPAVCDLEFKTGTAGLSKRFFCMYTDDCVNGESRRFQTRAATVLGVRPDAPQLLRELDVSLYIGTQWTILSREAASYIAYSARARELYDRLFSSCGISDETFVQTVIYDNPELLKRNSPSFNTLAFWSPDGDDPCLVEPCKITSKNSWRIVKELRQDWDGVRGFLFARKFDWEDKAVYEWVNQELLEVPEQNLSDLHLRHPVWWRHESRIVQDRFAEESVGVINNPTD